TTTDLSPVSVTSPSPPAATASPAATSPAAPAQERVGEFWRRSHFVVGGGLSPFGTRTYIDAPVYERAAPTYGTPGGMFFIQPSASVYLNEIVDFRLGLDARFHFLGRTKTTGAPDSSITAIALSPLMAELKLNPHPMFGLGANVAFGYMGLSSSHADVGAPFDATLDFGDQGGFFFGLQAFLDTWNGAIRLGYSLD